VFVAVDDTPCDDSRDVDNGRTVATIGSTDNVRCVCDNVGSNNDVLLTHRSVLRIAIAAIGILQLLFYTNAARK
jgi:hypothetical protein